jgi:hypothetical protein
MGAGQAIVLHVALAFEFLPFLWPEFIHMLCIACFVPATAATEK